MDRYAAAKRLLFTRAGLAHAVINVADAAGREFAAVLPAGVALIAVTADGSTWDGGGRRLDVRGTRATTTGLTLEIGGEFGRANCIVPLVGSFNVENVAVVLGVLLAWGYALDAAVAALRQVAAPPGRMEAFVAADGPMAVVDYAHTPDALAKVLRAARNHCAGRLIAVFGCGGDRDAGKRPLMGAVAEELADELWLTDDNPRTEDGAAIVAAIQSGLRQPARAHVERDRGAAIAAALAAARAGDVVVVAGKGHEDYQVVGRETRPFSDRDEVRRRLGRAA
jgi:UDP-N-acetylmuramoyl-L-alanyl-D-glutamate--2,6-diaminopimelate ligase